MNAPALSVVVPSVNGFADLERALEALERERVRTALEVLVPDRLGAALRAQVARRFPWATVLPAAPEATIPELRALGFRAASAPAVAVIEDHVLVPPGWSAAMLAALAGGADAVGGAVENAATETVVDWAAFLCEYSQLLPPLPAGPVAGLTGNNTAYRREALAATRPAWEAGRWEDHLHAALRTAGGRLVQHPEIVVGHRKHYTVAEYTGQRFLFARAWAGMRAREWSPGRRAGIGLLALALPLVLYVRIVRTVWRKRRHRGELVRALPLLVLFVCAWGLGEVTGYLAGAGQALRRVR
ncbi:MAG: glycosyl transferase [Gemmatimonadota bacterium]|nr:glycosyl transferase [Gemmatimonadota bacterium]